MARKLSAIAPPVVLLFTFAGLSLTVESTSAEPKRQSTPAQIVRNRHAEASRPESPERHEARRSPSTKYRNPFDENASAPPIDTPLPGPISRWRKTAASLNEQSSLETMTSSADLAEPGRIPWDQLPPADLLRQVGAQHSTGALSTVEERSVPPDPIGFTTNPYAQPVWLTTDGQPARPNSPIGQAAFDQPLPGRPNGSSVSLAFSASETDAASLPLIISDYDESPEGWLAEGQDLAKSAQSVDELSTVADLCHRVLNANSPAPIATAAGRLAAWAHNRRGELLIEADQTQDAVKDFQNAISLDPKCSLAFHNRAVTLAQQNDFEAALCDFNRVIELNPGLAIAYRNRAELLAAQGKMGEALPDYSRAVEALPENAELYRARAHVLQRLGESARAMEDLNSAIKLAPNAAANFAQRGNLLAERGEFADAAEEFQHAIEIDPNSAEAQRSLAWFHATCPDERYRDAEQALAAAQQAVELSPSDDYLVLDTLAAAYAEAGQFEKAIELQQQAISAAPPDIAEPMQKRLTLFEQGKPFHSDAEKR